MPTPTIEEREEEEDAEQVIVSPVEVENALSTLRLYVQQHENTIKELGAAGQHAEKVWQDCFSIKETIQYQVFL